MSKLTKRFLGALLGLFLGLASCAAFAFDPYPNFVFVPGAGQTMTGTAARGAAGGSFSVGAGGATFTQAAQTLPFKPSTSVNLRALFSPANIGRGLVAGAAVVIPMVAGDVLSALLNQACVRAFGGAMQLAPGGQWEQCHFTTTSQYYFITYLDNTTKDYTELASCTKEVVKQYGSNYTNWYHISVSVQGTNPGYSNQCNVWNNSDNSFQNGFSIARFSENVQVQDGWVSTTAADAESKIDNTLTQWSNASDPRVGTVVQKMWDAGQPTEGTLQPPTVQTPVNEPQQTTTQTGSDGKTTTTNQQTKDDYSCIVIQNGQAVSCNQYQTTTTTSSTVDNSTPGGTTTTSTVTVTKTADPSQQDPCNTDPTRAGCVRLGQPPNAETIPSQQVPVSWTNVVFSAPGGCPGALPYTMFGKTYLLPFDPMCDLMTTLRPLFLALGAAAAAYVFMEGLKS